MGVAPLDALHGDMYFSEFDTLTREETEMGEPPLGHDFSLWNAILSGEEDFLAEEVALGMMESSEVQGLPGRWSVSLL